MVKRKKERGFNRCNETITACKTANKKRKIEQLKAKARQMRTCLIVYVRKIDKESY